MNRIFCTYSIMHPVVYHIEKYSSEKLFDENDTTFLIATGKCIALMVRGGFDCYRKVSGSK